MEDNIQIFMTFLKEFVQKRDKIFEGKLDKNYLKSNKYFYSKDNNSFNLIFI